MAESPGTGDVGDLLVVEARHNSKGWWYGYVSRHPDTFDVCPHAHGTERGALACARGEVAHPTWREFRDRGMRRLDSLLGHEEIPL